MILNEENGVITPFLNFEELENGLFLVSTSKNVIKMDLELKSIDKSTFLKFGRRDEIDLFNFAM